MADFTFRQQRNASCWNIQICGIHIHRVYSWPMQVEDLSSQCRYRCICYKQVAPMALI